MNPSKEKALLAKTLSEKDSQILELSLGSFSVQEIARLSGSSVSYVKAFLSGPVAQGALDQVSAEQTYRLKALYEKSVDALRDALDSPSVAVRLKAAQEWFKITGRYGAESQQTLSAEDVAQALLKVWREERAAPPKSALSAEFFPVEPPEKEKRP